MEETLKALILAGGLGTRLRPISCTRPKTLFPIVNKPLLQWIFERLTKSNIKEVILAVNYQTEVCIKQQRIPRHGLKVKYSRDPFGKPLGTGGPIKKAEKIVGCEEPFLVLNGDIFADLNYAEIIREHAEKKALVTIALHKVADPSRYGVAELAENNRIKSFIEKPPKEAALTNMVNAGVYVLSPEIFHYIPKGKTVSIEREVFPKIAREGTLYGYIFDGLWMDIGEPEEYLLINKILLDSSLGAQKTQIGKEISLEKPVAIDEGVCIGEKSVIGPYAVLGRNVSVGKRVRIENSVVFPSATMADSSRITGAIIGEGAIVGKHARIGYGCIIGDYARVKDNVRLSKGVSICPAKEVSENVLTPRNIC